jgi:type I restriction enzyme S subunit
MSERSKVPIGDLVERVKTWNPSRSSGGTSFSYIDLSAVDQDLKTITSPREVDSRDAPSRARQLVAAGDVLVSTVRPNLNGVARVSAALDGATASTGFCVLRPRDNRLDGRYLFHWVRTSTFVAEMVKKATGASYPAVSDRIILESEVPLPPLSEQQRIAAVLDQAEALRAKRRATLAELDQLTETIFLEMFGDPATNPKRWLAEPLGKVLNGAEVFTDGDWVESKDQDPDGEVRLVQLADIGDGAFLNKSARYLTLRTAVRLKCTFLQPGDVLVARMPDPLGRACIFPGDVKRSVTVVDVCVIRPSDTGPDPSWLTGCINTTGFRGLIGRHATGTTRARISRGNLSRIPLIVPPIHLQREFALRVARVERLKAIQRASAAELDALFVSIQQRAFTGELEYLARSFHEAIP